MGETREPSLKGKACYLIGETREPSLKGRFSTLYLLIKIGCFVSKNRKKNFSIKNN